MTKLEEIQKQLAQISSGAASLDEGTQEQLAEILSHAVHVSTTPETAAQRVRRLWANAPKVAA